MIKVLSIGQASYDIYIQVDEFIKEGEKSRFINKIGCGGGLASNAAYLIGKWGLSSTFAGVVGNDVFGNRIKQEFQGLGSDTRYIETSFEKDTSISFNIVNNKSGNGTMLNVADEYSKLTHFDFDFQPDIIFIDGHDLYASKMTIERFPKAMTIMAANRYSQDIVEMAKKCEYLVCSKSFVEGATNIKMDYNNTNNLVNIYDSLRKKFDKQIIVITIDSKGTLYQIENQIKVSPALMVTPKDTTGAFDIFCGAFTYSIVKDHDLEKAIKFGNIAAGLSTQKVGTRLSVPKLEDVIRVYEQNA